VKLLDFGLAKALDKPVAAGNPSISSTLTIEGTQAGVILGTAAYIAPEQARGATVDKRADIWAYGCVLYEMLSGERAFAGDTVSDTLAAVLRAEPEWNASPISTRRLIRRCLEKDPKRRLRDIGEARLMIEELTTGSHIVPGNLAQGLRTRAMLWPAVALLAVVSLVLGELLWRSARPLPQQLMRFNLARSRTRVYSAILSPDGMRLVYSGRGTDGKLRLYTRQVDQEKATPLGGTEAALGSFFSPDGQFVGFFADGNLKKVSVHGGGPVVLCYAPEGRGGSWGEDGNIIAALSLTDSLSRVQADGGTPQRVTELNKDKKEITHRWPQVLPGSQAVLFTAHTTTANLTMRRQRLRPNLSRRAREGRSCAEVFMDGTYRADKPVLQYGSKYLLYMRQGTLCAAPMDVEGLQLRGPAVPVVEQVPTGVVVRLAHFAFSQNGTLVFGRRQTTRATLVWLEGNGRTQSLRAAESRYFGLRFFT